VLISLNSIKQFLNIGVNPAFGYVEVDCVVSILNTNAAKVFRVNVNGCNQVKQAVQHSGPLVGGGGGGKDCNLVWANLRGEEE
jgi:hypothetical protein